MTKLKTIKLLSCLPNMQQRRSSPLDAGAKQSSEKVERGLWVNLFVFRVRLDKVSSGLDPWNKG